MIRILIVTLKLALIAFFVWIAWLWSAALASSGYFSGLLLAAHIALNIAVAIAASCLVWLLNRRNAARAAITLFLVLAGAFVGLFFADPSMWGSYDHGFGETEHAMITLGPLGAIAGFAISQMIRPSPPTAQSARSEPDS